MKKSAGLPPPSGFTLIEFAIVLIVIALILGAGFVGTSMVRDAKIRNVMGDVTKYTQGFNNYMDKYHALPGDDTIATSKWGTDSGGCPDPATGLTATPYSTTKKQATCNGNGDGYIASTSATYYETFRAWQQLSASGLLDKTSDVAFNGIAASGGALNAVIGVNVPATSLNTGGFTIKYLSVANGGDTDHFTFANNHAFFLGSVTTNSFTTGALLTPAEALKIDGKLDDGIPGTGKIQPHKNTINPNCTTSSTAYKTSNSSPACSLIFITEF